MAHPLGTGVLGGLLSLCTEVCPVCCGASLSLAPGLGALVSVAVSFSSPSAWLSDC